MRCFRSAFGAYGEAIPETRHSNMVCKPTIGNQTRVNSLLTVGPMMISAAKIACHSSDCCSAVKLQSVWRQALPCKHFSHVPLTLTVDLVVYISPYSLYLNDHNILFIQSSFNNCAGHFYSTAFTFVFNTFCSIIQQTCVSQPLSPLPLSPAQSLLRLVSFSTFHIYEQL